MGKKKQDVSDDLNDAFDPVEGEEQEEAVQTVKMYHHGRGHTADVHPNEVGHMIDHGWTENPEPPTEE